MSARQDEILSLPTAVEWRAWLAEKHDKRSVVWLVFYKKSTRSGQHSNWIRYEEAVREALCHGWIDSLVKRVDERRYRQKFTPRKAKSKWSASNKKRIAALQAEGKLAAAGKRLIAAAKRDGSWDLLPDAEKQYGMPAELEEVLANNETAAANFGALPPSHKKRYALWIASAKRPATRQRRATRAATMLAAGERLGLM